MTEQTAEPKAPVPGSPEYDAAMIAVKTAARTEQGNPYTPVTTEQTAEKPVRPDHVPEKFWNAETGQVDVENLLKSYSELETKGTAKDDDTPVDPPKDDTATKKIVEDAGLDWTAMTSKVAEKGDIEDADYAALEAKGIPRELVKDIIETRKAQHEAEQAKAIDYIGGQEETTKLISWAQSNLSAKDIDYYDQMLAGPHWRVAVDSLKARHAAGSKTAAEPRLETPAVTVPNAQTGYASREDMKADMRNPLYHDRTSKGEAFRAEVMRKAAVSPWRST